MAKSFFKPRHNDNNFVLAVGMTAAKMLLFVVLLLMVSGGGLLLGVAKAWIETAPELDLSVFNSQAQTSFIYDKYGTLVTEFSGTENRINVTLDEVPQNLIDAVIAVEDARFYEHNGVDVKRIVGAFVQNLLNNSMQGGSTITTQLIKLTMLSSEQTYKRKLQEAYLALQLEEQVSKEQILQEYLNTIFMGGSVYGVKAAALDYFGKDLVELSLRECAMLARMIRSPNNYNPRRCYYTLNTPEKCEDGADYVLGLMLAQGYITQAEYSQAMSERLTVMPTSSTGEMYDHAYFVEYAIYDVVTKMLRQENLEDNSANRNAMENRLRTGGYHIYTTLDPAVQQAVQDTLSTWDKYPETRYETDAAYQASLGGGEYKEVVQPQAAVAITDWRTGALVAIVGGRDEPTQKWELNRAYQMDMPVGSSLKPLSVYGPAIDLGYSPATPVLNLPIPIDGWVSERGYPNNYGGGGWTGVESMRRAMTKSHNYSTAQTLFEYVTIDNSVAYLKRLGVSDERIDATGSGLALGSSGVTPLEMAAAFGAVANSGVYLEPYAFTEVRYADNQTVYLRATDLQVSRQAFKESTAWLLVDMLEDCVSSSGTGSRARFGNMTVAGNAVHGSLHGVVAVVIGSLIAVGGLIVLVAQAVVGGIELHAVEGALVEGLILQLADVGDERDFILAVLRRHVVVDIVRIGVSGGPALLIVSVGVALIVVGLLITAGNEGQNHDESEKQRKKLLHSSILPYFSGRRQAALRFILKCGRTSSDSIAKAKGRIKSDSPRFYFFCDN